RYLKKLELIKNDIYEVGSLEQLDFIWELLKKDKDFCEFNQRGHRMYSVGYKRYHEFIAGQDFSKYRERLSQLDVPMLSTNPTTIEYKVWKRSGILRTQVIAGTNYTCEMDANHASFLAESTHKPYMEAHHVIPLHLQENFENSLDVYANIICLCPICHRKIHFGIIEERRDMVDEIFENRKERLLNSGFELSKSEFERIVLAKEENV
ncbi:MAG: HNH endonuclease, partial [Schwartzia sp.]|nr:HNH endonuclease [Schwartzia sp. (in: firmicutes)]